MSSSENWIKYGRKQVNGRLRIYYRCRLSPRCKAKRHRTYYTDSEYTDKHFGVHDHAIPADVAFAAHALLELTKKVC
jgi:hypothetical protein